jgi:hypothetical protein
MSYVTTVLADNPWHFWRCADPGGSYLHDIGASPAALLAHNLGSDVGYSGPASDGGSCTCNNNAAYVHYDSESLAYPLSAEVWFWLAQIVAEDKDVLTCASAAGASLAHFRLNHTRKVTVFSAAGALVSNTVLSFNAWHHLVATCDSSNVKLYLDGSLDSTGAGASPAAVDAIYGLGFYPTGNTIFFYGALAEAAIYKSTLSATQVAAHFAAADNVPSRPVFHQRGQWTDVTGSGAPVSADLSRLIADVEHTYRNAP